MSVDTLPERETGVAKNRREHLGKAVHQSSLFSRAGIGERMFTWMFKGLVYPQIWEDPEVDIEALELGPDSRIVTIASGGCNVLSYLTADPREIIAVDLNTSHVALTRLKLAAARHLPNYSLFYRFFGEADEKANIKAYKRFLREEIDDDVRRYWEGRDLLFRKRITLFSRDLYHHGLLGYFIAMAHWIARMHGVDAEKLIEARSIDEQRRIFDSHFAPFFDRKLVRWATSKKMSLFGLGIPPAQYEALAGGGDMANVLRERLEKLACHFDISDNYFAWQAFGRRYGGGPSGPLPPYLQKAQFDNVRARVDRVSVHNVPFTTLLQGEPDASLTSYILLDAQDWMNDDQLNELWSEITRTARPCARVIFRTAGKPSLLPGRVRKEILDRWDYREEQSADLHARDRSSIYGGFHLYVFKG